VFIVNEYLVANLGGLERLSAIQTFNVYALLLLRLI
jgi:hypothetical protein